MGEKMLSLDEIDILEGARRELYYLAYPTPAPPLKGEGIFLIVFTYLLRGAERIVIWVILPTNMTHITDQYGSYWFTIADIEAIDSK